LPQETFLKHLALFDSHKHGFITRAGKAALHESHSYLINKIGVEMQRKGNIYFIFVQ